MHSFTENQPSSIDKDTVLEEVIRSLSKTQKELPCKYFYNSYGSDLFDQITELDEYYLTRAEISILNDNIDEISNAISKEAVLIELGSGSNKKIRIILDKLKNPEAYVPVEISEEYLYESVRELKSIYPNLEIFPVVADYTRPFELPDIYSDHKNKVVYYPGSTIGNFDPERAANFLKRISELCSKESGLLIGIDLKKDKVVLERAYNDQSGLTEKFNLNILRNLNYMLDSNFDLKKWEHNAFYNEDMGRIEMHLVSTEEHKISVNGKTFHFEKGETIHTENSYKFTVEEFESLIKSFYKLKKVWKDSKNRFALCYFVVI